MTTPALLEVGRITKPHGVRGEVLVALSTHREERLAPGAVLQTDAGPLVVRSASPHQDRFIVRFDGVDDRSAAEALRGTVLRAEPVDEPGTLWVHEAIGARVVEQRTGTERGTVVAVVANPAHDLLELDTGALVPVVFVVAGGEAEPGVLVVDPPDGLFD